MQRPTPVALIACLILAGCAADANEWPHDIEEVASFERPWALTFMPDGRLLVTEKPGRLFIVTTEGQKTEVAGVPEVDYGGQGGFGDISLHPAFESNGIVYISYAEAGDDNTRGAAVARAQLVESASGARLDSVEVIWRQVPKVTGKGHYGHRLMFDAEGYLWISSGERQKFDPSQDMQSNLGKILRLNADGSVPDDNPFFANGGVAQQVWSLGHRNPLGFDFDAEGQLWNVEMGPKGGDELNRVQKGGNYGYPEVSNGDHYSGKNIPDHDTRPEFIPPAAWWTPVISPGDLLIYDGMLFPAWEGDGFIAGLSSKSLVRVEFDGEDAVEAERFDMGERIRGVEQGPDGALWIIEDGDGGRLLKLAPASTAGQ